MPPAARLLLAVLLVTAGCATAERTADVPPRPEPLAATLASRYVRAEGALGDYLTRCRAGTCAVPIGTGVALDTIVVAGEGLEVRFSRDLGDVPFRPETAERLTEEVREALAGVVPDVPVVIVTRGSAVQDLVPNAARAAADRDPSRLFAPPVEGPPLVRRAEPPHRPTRGLAGRHVALWPSHGWYYNAASDVWGWQRARLFTTVEDLLTVDLVVSRLTPMLERAGAVVLLPRERDTQRLEVIVDDGAAGYSETGDWRVEAPGFALRPAYGAGENPFRLGTARTATGGTATWTPDIPEPGEYAVHVSYAAGDGRSEAARYTVRHAGGTTDVLVNQQIGGGTWVYLGTFRFESGSNGSVSLAADEGVTVSADAVRFGGGMGIVARGGSTSGRPRWTEAGRYYEQFAGAPAVVYNTTGEPNNDYVDDYRSRGEWVNWLRGAPFGPTGHADSPGLGIPVDLSLAWHTDAGIDRDGTIGTLLIYNVPGMDSTRTFPNGVSRLANRDLADGLLSEIVADLRRQWDAEWSQRQLWDRPYSEATRPNVPSALLELLSHQNFYDMRYGRDPRFRFDAARAVYKALGRFLAQQRGEPFVPQPLRPTHLQATLEEGAVRLAWRPQPDPLEPDAVPTGYVVYTREGDGGWDNGRYVAGTETTVPVPPVGQVRSWRVAAVNAGGESRPSVALAVGVAAGGGAPVLVVDGFDRIAPPDVVAEPDSAGFLDPVGVPDGVDVMTVGRQLVFDPEAEYDTDADPGWGQSANDLETTVIAGNTHDLAAAHGRALLAAGRSFVSATDEAVEAGTVRLADYPLVDLALGLERRTPWPDAARPPAFEALPEALRQRLGAYLDGGGALVVSGAHWASDATADPAGAAWVRDRLGVAAAAPVPGADALAGAGTAAPIAFNTTYGREFYAVRRPDAVTPTDAARTLFQYPGSGRSAAVAGRRTVAFGVPIEAVPDAEARAALVRAVLAALAE